MRNQKFSHDIIGQLLAEIRQLQQEVRLLKNAQVTTVPIYDDASFLTGDAVEGQIVIDTITVPGTPQLQFRQNSTWNVV